MSLRSFLIIIVLFAASSQASSPKRFVSLRLRAAWSTSSFATEAAYAIAEFDSAHYWNFAGNLSSRSSELLPDADDPSPQLLYKSSITAASQLLPAPSLNLLAASLSLRRFNPRVVM
jgi:hypothetical protein